MLARLPELIDPIQLADRNASLEGELAVNSLDRLAEMLSKDAGSVTVKLFFGRLGKLATIEGHIAAVLMLKCQRCLEPVEWSIDSEIKLGIVTSLAQADKLLDGYEPFLLIDEDKIPLKNIVEDELLLSLPDIPKHINDCIESNLSQNKLDPVPKTAQATNKNPFSILADLKKLETYNGSTKE
jgi:uncharacterized protein